MAILEIKNLKKYFPVTSGVFLQPRGQVHAVDNVSFSLNRGQTLGLVGESGCGKSTLARCLMGLYAPTDGSITLDGDAVFPMSPQKRLAFASRVQMIFQDPYESLNPRHTVRQILMEKFVIHGQSIAASEGMLAPLLNQVGLESEALEKYPHEFSGGQRQRIGIARAVSMTPEIIICDEPVSALDVSVQSKILNLLLDLQTRLGLTYLFISHDLSVVRHMSDRIIVMYLGKIVEIADADDLYAHPCHPYTQALLDAVPIPDPDAVRQRTPLQGEIPSVENPPKGCRFHTRCPHARHLCQEAEPVLRPTRKNKSHKTACHFFD